MRYRDLRTGLHIRFGSCHGVTTSNGGKLVMECHTVYGPEGYHDLEELIKLNRRKVLRQIKLIDRVYDPHER